MTACEHRRHPVDDYCLLCEEILPPEPLAIRIRCDRHTGEPWPARCYACESLAAEYAALSIPTAER